MCHIQIVFDGVCGTFKSRLAKDIALLFNYKYISCGLIYRIIAFYGKGLYGEDMACSIEQIIDSIKDIRIIDDGVMINKRLITRKDLKINHFSNSTALISGDIRVKHFVHNLVRSYAESESIVIEGRECASEIFENAFCAFYMYASISDRMQNEMNKTDTILTQEEYNKIYMQILKRDCSDISIQPYPPQAHYNAIVIDVQDFNFEYDNIYKHILTLIESRS